MATYIKVDGEYKEVLAAYKKQAGVWTLIDNLVTTLSDLACVYNPRAIDAEPTLTIYGESQYVGKDTVTVSNGVVADTFTFTS